MSTALLLIAILFICIGGYGSAKNNFMLNVGGFAIAIILVLIWVLMGN